MKKIILVFMAGILLFGANLYAQGDLVVNGELAVGVGTPSNYFRSHIYNETTAANKAFALKLEALKAHGNAVKALVVTGNITSADNDNNFWGSEYALQIQGASNSTSKTWTGDMYSQTNSMQLGITNGTGTYTHNGALSTFSSQITALLNNSRIYNLNSASGYESALAGGTPSGSGAINFTDFKHYTVIENAPLAGMVISNQYGLYVDKLISGSVNYGIALAGNGPGSDIAFGPNQEIRVYRDNSSGRLIMDGAIEVNGPIYRTGTGLLHADYVFSPEYEIESIEEHSEFMWKHMHLSAVPKATKNEKGQEIVELGAHNRGILEELEKAHIYIDKLNERLKMLEDKLAQTINN